MVKEGLTPIEIETNQAGAIIRCKPGESKADEDLRKLL
jgi:hypothetical protein